MAAKKRNASLVSFISGFVFDSLAKEREDQHKITTICGSVAEPSQLIDGA